MRRQFLPLFSALVIAGLALPAIPVYAQMTKQDREDQQKREQEQEKAAKEKEKKKDTKTPAELAPRHADGPCPYVKVLYDAARDVEFRDAKEASAAVLYTGEIEGVSSDCAYHSDSPIHVAMNIAFSLGRGPLGDKPQKTYRYWVAVTDRNREVLAKEYFDLPITFPQGQDRVTVNQVVEDVTIPRAAATVAGNNFEVLVGFDLTPAQADFNRQGKRFRVNAGQLAETGSTAKQ
jgi:hypothetical protein